MSELVLEKLTDRTSGRSVLVGELLLLKASPVFAKTITSEPCFKVMNRLLYTNCDVLVSVGDSMMSYQEGVGIALPGLVNGTDYAIYATVSGLVVSNNFTALTGFTAENSRRIGGFHYQDGFINERSIWDLKFKPACDDPRGMVRTVGGFWSDIYLLNTTPDLLGTSAYNAQIADGSSCPKKPAVWGGNGTEQYTTFTQYIATEVLAAYGKRLPNQHEFSVLAQGSKTGHVSSSDPVKTKFDVNARSMVGCEQVSGHMWQWGSECWDRGNGASSYDWNDMNTDGKGQVHAMVGSEGVGASLFGAYWGHAGFSGSRASVWNYEPWDSGSNVAARGVCDHVQLV